MSERKTATSGRERMLPQLDEVPIGFGDWTPSEKSSQEFSELVVKMGICPEGKSSILLETATEVADIYITSKRLSEGGESREAVKCYLRNLDASLQSVCHVTDAVRQACNWLDSENEKRPPRRARILLERLFPGFFPTSSELGLPIDDQVDGDWLQVDEAIDTVQAWARPRQKAVASALREFSRGQSDREAHHCLAQSCAGYWKWLKEHGHAKGSRERYAEAVLRFIEANGTRVPELGSFLNLLRR